MPRVFGYASLGVRAYGKKNWGERRRTNAIGAIVGKFFLTVSLFKENIDRAIFSTWLKEDLIPKLPQNSVVVLDNASFHKGPEIEELFKNTNNHLFYLPPYSPDLNPIEHSWSQAKAILRRLQCSVETLFKLPVFYQVV